MIQVFYTLKDEVVQYNYLDKRAHMKKVVVQYSFLDIQAHMKEVVV